jgi:hypothetical protein
MTSTEAEYVEYLKQLIELEQAGERSTLSMGPYTAIMIIGAVQLAWRHPGMNPTMCSTLHDLIDQMEPWFVGTLGQEIIAKGWDTSEDRPATATMRNCPDCDVAPGQPHDPNCDVARCLATGGQRLGHGDEEHDCGNDVWTGQWPGTTR